MCLMKDLQMIKKGQVHVVIKKKQKEEKRD